MKIIWKYFHNLIIEENFPKYVPIIVIGLTGLNKIAGFILKAVIAHYLGASRIYDIFIAANTIPEFLTNIFFIGLTNAAIIPVLVSCLKHEKKKDFWGFVSNILNIGSIIYAACAISLIIGANWLVRYSITRIAVPVQPFTEEELSKIVLLTRVLLIPQLILGISVFTSSILMSFHKFIITQFAPLIYNIGNIVGIIIMFSLNGKNEWGLTLGIFIGSVLHLLVQIPQLIHIGFKYKLIANIKDKYLKQFFRLSGYRIIGTILDQAYTVISRTFAIGLVAGSLSAFNFALNIASIPVSVFGVTFATIVFPKLSKEYVNQNIQNFKNLFFRTFDKILFLTIPVIGIMLILRLPIVRLSLGLGKNTSFVWEDTLITAWSLFFISLGILPETIKTLFTRVIYARNNSLVPLIISIIGIIIDILGIILLTNYFSNLKDLSLTNFEINFDFFSKRNVNIASIGGIALASTITVSITTIIYLIYVDRRIIRLFNKEFLSPIIKKIISLIIMLIFMYLSFKRWDEVLNTARIIPLFILTVSTMIIGIVAFLWGEFILRDKILIERLPKFLK